MASWSGAAGLASAVKVLLWVVEGLWRSCVDAARDVAAADAEITLLYVVDEELSALARGSFAGLLGRRRPERDQGVQADGQAMLGAEALLTEARLRLGRPAATSVRRGRVEREVVIAAAESDLLVVARDGDAGRLGPRSLGREARFVVDHAPCGVLLVWPGTAPRLDTVPPHPPAQPSPPPPPHPPG